MGYFLLSAAIAALAVACMPQRKLVVRTDFITDDPVLARILKACAEEWAKAGVLIASIVTVNENVPGAMRVIRIPRDNMAVACNSKNPKYRGDGCGAIEDGRWDTMYIPEDLQNEGRLRVVLLHEMAHIFMCQKTHLSPELIGVMHPNANSARITQDDLDFIGQYTIVVPPSEMPA